MASVEKRTLPSCASESRKVGEISAAIQESSLAGPFERVLPFQKRGRACAMRWRRVPEGVLPMRTLLKAVPGAAGVRR